MATPAPPRQQGSTTGAAGTGKEWRGKPRVITGFTSEDLVIKKPSTVDERAKYRRKREQRAELQKQIDAIVLAAYKEWLAAGKPRKQMLMPPTVWVVRKVKEDDARFMLSKAAMLIQRQLKYGDCPDAEDDPKKIELCFFVLDRNVKVEEENAPAES